MAEVEQGALTLPGDAAEKNPEYAYFEEKFKPKKTTDDCYTPKPVFDAVEAWAAKEYGIQREKIKRPFFPGGDYQAEEYPDDCVVLDNPPFSILSEIIRYYCRCGVRFFLFAPALTLFTATECQVCYLAVGVSITYANGAEVNTSFITNLDTARVRTAPELHEAVKAANEDVVKANKSTLPKYSYPDEVVTAAILNRWSKYGVEWAANTDDCIYIGALDAQREAKKSIFGGGFLLKPQKAAEHAAAERAAAERAAAERAAAERAAAERAAAERAAAERAAATVWQLSDRERGLLGMEPLDTDQTKLF